MDIVTRELNIFWNDLHEINSMITLDSPVEYLGNVKSDQKWHLLPTPFKCLEWSQIDEMIAHVDK